MLLSGYRRSVGRTVVTWTLFVLSAGLLRLFMHWWKHWLLLATHTPCSLDTAEKLLITERYEGKHTVYYVKDVVTLNADTLAAMEREPERWGDYVPLGKCAGPVQMAVHFAGGVFKRECLVVGAILWDGATNDLFVFVQPSNRCACSSANSCATCGTTSTAALAS